MDYGHPLTFGTFITPTNADPLEPVRLAQLAESAGLDYVGIQDHPYQPRFHEMWALLSWMAGQTTSIRFMPDVLNTPMRNAAVVARSAASLDLLSGGRIELGLGAGAFWDAMVAMGVERLSPGESVEALGEAIEVLRTMWDTSRSGPVSTSGTHHRLEGAQVGPAPSQRIPLLIGAGGPRMLRLIGRSGDGWVLPGGTSQIESADERNQIIDDAAQSAGRDPREIRRIINYSPSSMHPDSWAQELTGLALDYGISTFFVSSDEPTLVETFARDVAPAVREAVAAERRLTEAPEGIVAPLYVRERRKPGISYESLPPALAANAVEPGDVRFGSVKNNYVRGGSPGLVLHPADSAEVAAVLTWARAQNVPLGVRSGGHGFSGRSTNNGGIVIDLGRLNKIEILDPARKLVRIEPGARWAEVSASLRPHGWALSSGDSGGVGVGGLATAGGIGFLARAHGLTIDHVRAVELVLADGSQIRASRDEHAELFWGMRGAGFAFGIVTAFEFEVDEVDRVGFAQLTHDVSNDPEGFLVRWGAAVENSPRDTTSFLIMSPPREGRMLAVTMNMVDSADSDVVVDRLNAFAALAPLVGQQALITTYDGIVNAPAHTGHHGVGEPVSRSGLLEHITPEFARDATALLRSNASYFFQIRAFGGATADVDPDATAFAHRSANFAVLAMSPSAGRIDPQWEQMRDHYHGIYLSFETDQHPDRLNEAFPPATLERLRALKATYDPENVFRDNFNLLPEPARDKN